MGEAAVGLHIGSNTYPGMRASSLRAYATQHPRIIELIFLGYPIPRNPGQGARGPPIVLQLRRPPMPLGTFVTLIAAAASSNDPCTAQCRLHTCAIFNSSLSCSELSGLGCDCVSPCPL